MSDLFPLKSLTFADRPVPSSDIGAPGELCWLPLDRLRIDPAYQRVVLETGKANIRRMIEGFSWLLFGTLTVAKRGRDLYAIIDGQHRATAAMLHGGIEAVPCLILKGGQAEEALAFSAINGNVTRIHALQSFRALATSGEESALALIAICAEGGASIAPYPKGDLKPGETMALRTLRVCLRRHGEAVLIAALKVLRVAEPGAGLSASAIMGMCDALSKRSPDAVGIKPEKLGGLLAGRGGVSALSEKAIKRKAARGGTEWANFSAVVIEALSVTERSAGVPMSRLMAGR
jgi:hypothetical protein